MTSTSTSPTRRFRRAPMAFALSGALALAVAGCGGDDEKTTSTTAGPSTQGAPLQLALADDVPAGAAGFAEATIRPGGSTKAGIEELTSAFGVTDPGPALIKALDLDDEDLAGGASFEDAIIPFLGDQIGGFVVRDPASRGKTESAAAFVASVRDAAGLRKGLQKELDEGTKRELDGQTYYQGPGSDKDVAVWIGDETFAVGQIPAVEAAIKAGPGADLAGNDRFKKAVEQVRTEDLLGGGYVDLQQADVLNSVIGDVTNSGERQARLRRRLRQLERSGGSAAVPGLERGLDSLSSIGGDTLPKVDAAIAMGVELRSGRIRLQVGGTQPEGLSAPTTDSEDELANLPAGSWLAAGVGGFQQAFKSYGTLLGGSGTGTTSTPTPAADPKALLGQLRQLTGINIPDSLLDALGGLESGAIAVRGDSITSIGGAVVLRAKDAAGASTILDQLRAVVQQTLPLRFQERSITGADKGVVAQFPGAPFLIAAGVKGDRLAIGLGTDAVGNALTPSSKLGDDPVYGQAQELLGGKKPTAIIDATKISQFLQSLPIDELRDRDGQMVLAVLQRLKLISAGGTSSGSTFNSTLALSYAPGTSGGSGGTGTTTTTP